MYNQFCRKQNTMRKECTQKWVHGTNTMNMTDKESGQDLLFLILPSTMSVVDKGTSLHCYYVKMCGTGEYACDTCSTDFYIIGVKGCSFVYHSNC